MFEIGQQVAVTDRVDCEKIDLATIIFIEPDTDINEVFLYLRAFNEALNINTDPRLDRTFWRIIEGSSKYLATKGD